MERIKISSDDFPDFINFISQPGVKLLNTVNKERYTELEYNTNQVFVLPTWLYGKVKVDKFPFLIDDYKMFDRLDAWITDQTELAIDTETDGLTRFRKCLGVSFSNGDEYFYIPMLKWNEKELVPYWPNYFQQRAESYIRGWLKQANKKWIGHNLVFDAITLENAFGVNIIDNAYSDTALLHHTCISEDPPHGLKVLAAEFIDPKAADAQEDLAENVEKLGGVWKKDQKDFFMADVPVLAKYAALDPYYTFKLHQLWYGEIEKQGLQKLWFEEVLPLTKVMYQLNTTGINIDVAYFEQLAKEVPLTIEKCEEDILEEAKGKIEEYEFDYIKKKVKITERSELGKLLRDSGLTVDTGRELITEWYKQKYGVKRVFNFGSKDHLGFLLYQVLNLPVLQTTKTGQASTSKATLDELLEQIDGGNAIIDKIKLRAKEMKLLNTYILPILENQIDGKVYPQFNQIGTSSGRFTSGEPINFQTLPRDDHRIKKGFIAGKGKLIVDADFSSLEPRCLLKDTKVLTTKGYSSLENLNIGDKVSTKFGYRSVLNKWSSRKSVYHLVSNKGVISGSGDHKIFTKNRGWVTLDQVKITDQIEKNEESIDNFEQEVSLPFYSKNALKNPNIKSFGKLVLDEKWAWILGAMLGDGTIRIWKRKSRAKEGKNLNITLNVESYIQLVGLKKDGVTDKFFNIFAEFGFTPVVWQDCRNKGGQLDIVHIGGVEVPNLMCTTFNIAYPIYDEHRPSKKTRIPDYIFNAPENIKLAFLAGLIDTDGYVRWHGENSPTVEISISSSKAEFIGDIQFLAESMGLNGSIGLAHKKDHKVYAFKFRQDSVFKLANKPKFGENFACKRKSELLKNRLRAIPEPNKSVTKPLKIFEIIKTNEEADLIDITVEEVEEFYAQNIRVHNCFAEMSGESEIKRIYTEGLDLYSHIYKMVMRDDTVSANENDPNFLKKVKPEARQQAKVYSLGLAYQMSEYKLASTLGIDIEDALDIKNRYFEAFPSLKKYQEKCNNDIHNKFFVSNLIGRKRRAKLIPLVRRLYPKADTRNKKHMEQVFDRIQDNMDYQAIANKLKSKGKPIRDSKDFFYAIKNEYNNSSNFPIQGLAASIANASAIEFLLAAQKENLDAKLALQIHDQVTVITSEKDATRAAELLKYSMENNKVADLISVEMKTKPTISKTLAETK